MTEEQTEKYIIWIELINSLKKEELNKETILTIHKKWFESFKLTNPSL